MISGPDSSRLLPITFMRGVGILMLALSCASPGGEWPVSASESAASEAPEAQFTIVYDNNRGALGLNSAWGFACVVELPDRTVLFDTGGDGAILMSNMQHLRVDPASIDMVVLSHVHNDHVGGLRAFLQANHDVTVCMPASFPASLKEQVRRAGARLRQIRDAEELAPGVYTTGELTGRVTEQSLVLRTNAGTIVLTGCAHPGIVRVVQQAKSVAPGDVALVMGGFHLGGHGESQIESIIRSFRELAVRFVAPCHCTGERAILMFRQAYGRCCLPAAVGYRASSDAVAGVK